MGPQHVQGRSTRATPGVGEEEGKKREVGRKEGLVGGWEDQENHQGMVEIIIAGRVG